MTISLPDCAPRHDWTLAEVEALFALPFNDLVFRAQCCLRQHFDPHHLQRSTLLNVKTGGCPEDCAYCPQSAHYDTGVEKAPMMAVEAVVAAAREAQDQGATRFCMGAAWKQPRADSDEFAAILAMVREVKALGLETCATLGMLDQPQVTQLREAGLDYYNHNLDTSESYYQQVISTRDYQDRLDTLDRVRDAGMKVCCGGIVGMGETPSDRAELLRTLANLDTHPESVPINHLIKIQGTPLAEQSDVDILDFVRCIAVARVLMPASYIRLSAGRAEMNDAEQALCFLAGANSVFWGDKLLTADNAGLDRDQALLAKLGLEA